MHLILLQTQLQTPFSQKLLKEHTKRLCLQSGWLCKEGENYATSQDELEWRWKMKNGCFVPKWQPDENITTVEMISRISNCI